MIEVRFGTWKRPEVTSTPSREHDGVSCCSSTRAKTDPRPPGSNTWNNAQKHVQSKRSRLAQTTFFYGLTWNNLRAERRRVEGGELLLSINTVRPFTLAAGLWRMEKGGLGRRVVKRKVGCVFGQKPSCTFGPNRFENKTRNKKFPHSCSREPGGGRHQVGSPTE